jgi:hypothetical protein
MLDVRTLLVEEDMLMTSCLSKTILNFGDRRGPCDREDDRGGDLCLTTILSIKFNLQ